MTLSTLSADLGVSLFQVMGFAGGLGLWYFVAAKWKLKLEMTPETNETLV